MPNTAITESDINYNSIAPGSNELETESGCHKCGCCRIPINILYLMCPRFYQVGQLFRVVSWCQIVAFFFVSSRISSGCSRDVIIYRMIRGKLGTNSVSMNLLLLRRVDDSIHYFIRFVSARTLNECYLKKTKRKSLITLCLNRYYARTSCSAVALATRPMRQ